MTEFWFHVFHNWGKTFSIAPSLLWLGIGFLLVIIAGYKHYLYRPYFIYRLLTGFYYVYIPLSFFLVSLMYYAIADLEKSMYLALAQSRQSITSIVTASSEKALAPYMKQHQGRLFLMQDISTKYTHAMAEQFALPVQLDKIHVAEHIEIDIPAYFTSIAHSTQQLFATKMGAFVDDALYKAAPETGKISSKVLRIFWEEKLQFELKQGVAIKVGQDMIEELFLALYKHIYPLWLFLLLPPFIEHILFIIFFRSPRQPSHTLS